MIIDALLGSYRQRKSRHHNKNDDDTTCHCLVGQAVILTLVSELPCKGSHDTGTVLSYSYCRALTVLVDR